MRECDQLLRQLLHEAAFPESSCAVVYKARENLTFDRARCAGRVGQGGDFGVSIKRGPWVGAGTEVAFLYFFGTDVSKTRTRGLGVRFGVGVRSGSGSGSGPESLSFTFFCFL